MLVGIAVGKTGKARCGVSLPMHREDEGELIDRAWKTHVPERARKLEGSEGCGAARLDLTVEDQKAGQRMQGHELGRQGAVPAGRLYRPSRAVDGFRHLASRECDNGELRLADVMHADITERLGQGQRLFDEGPRSLQIPGILAHGPGAQEGIGQPLRAATPAQD